MALCIPVCIAKHCACVYSLPGSWLYTLLALLSSLDAPLLCCCQHTLDTNVRHDASAVLALCLSNTTDLKPLRLAWCAGTMLLCATAADGDAGFWRLFSPHRQQICHQGEQCWTPLAYSHSVRARASLPHFGGSCVKLCVVSMYACGITSVITDVCTSSVTNLAVP